MRKIGLLLAATALIAPIIACGGRQSSSGTGASTTDQIVSTSTPVPIPTAPASIPADLPKDDDLKALIVYANQMSPIIIAAGEILQRDGEILKQSEEDDQVLCDGRLASDSQILTAYLDQVRGINAPSEADAIHRLVIESGEAWNEAMDKVDEFCSTGNALHKIPAAIKFWEAAAKIQDAGNRFWLLLMSEGVEAWVQR
jgi:hypothetical protein